jgi:hypothetical protein
VRICYLTWQRRIKAADRSAGFEAAGGGPRQGRLLEAGKGKAMGFPTEFQKGSQPY